MNNRLLKGTGMFVPELCIGTVSFGREIDDKGADKIVSEAIDCGANFFDTADFYTGGESEKMLGRVMRGRRDKIIVETKVFFPVGEGSNEKGLSRRHILESVDKSLKALQTDYIDIYYMHAPDKNTPIEETLDTMSTLVRDGKVRYIGVSNYNAWQICEMLWKCDKNNLVAPSLTQVGYNLLTRGLEHDLVPFLEKHNMGMIVYQPLCAGLLTGKYGWDQPIPPNSRFAVDPLHRDRYWTEKNFKAVEELKVIARELGISLVALALKWCLAHDYVSSVLMGVSRESQLAQNLRALEENAEFTPEVMTRCDEIWKTLDGTQYRYYR